MTIAHWLVTGSIFLLLVTALLHSILGEKMLIGPMLRQRGNRILEVYLARLLLRFGWHVTSLMWVLLAISLYAVTFRPSSASPLILVSIGSCFLFVGLFDLVFSKGRHVGWLPLLLIGVFSLIAAFING